MPYSQYLRGNYLRRRELQQHGKFNYEQAVTLLNSRRIVYHIRDLKSTMDFLQEKSLLYKGRNLVPAENLITKNGLILYYFTSMDCNPCRSFDEKLKKVYSEAKVRHLHLLIVIVSSDDDKHVMTKGLKVHYPEFYAVPFEDELRVILTYNYGVTHIPQLIVVRKNGEIVTRKGRTEIENIGINVLITWPE